MLSTVFTAAPTATAAVGDSVSIVEALGFSVLGVAIVFFMLVLLMVVIKVMNVVLKALEKSEKKEAAPAAPAAAAAPAAPKAEPAPGSAGEVKLYNVPEKQAAMIMAIVADKMGKPLNELRFKSIREVK